MEHKIVHGPTFIQLSGVATPPRKRKAKGSETLAELKEFRISLSNSLANGIQDHCRYRAELASAFQRSSALNSDTYIQELVDHSVNLIDLYLEKAVPILINEAIAKLENRFIR